MKIRIKGNTLRFRLTQSEVAYFTEHGYLEEKTEFGEAVLTYAIKNSNSDPVLKATFNGNKICLLIPEEQANKWTQTNVVGLQNEQEIGNEKKLFLLLEKDFKCLDETSEDQSDNYPNPLAEKHQNG